MIATKFALLENEYVKSDFKKKKKKQKPYSRLKIESNANMINFYKIFTWVNWTSSSWMSSLGAPTNFSYVGWICGVCGEAVREERVF